MLTTSRGSELARISPGRLDRHVGARPDGDADIGACQGRGVVHAVADHGDLQTAGLQLGDLVRLVLGQDLREHLVDAEVTADRFADLAGVAGDHHHVPAHRLELGDGVAGLGPDLVLERDPTDDRVAAHQVQDRGAPLLPLLDPVRQLLRFGQGPFPKQRRPTDGVGLPVDGGFHPAAGDGPEPGRRRDLTTVALRR